MIKEKTEELKRVFKSENPAKEDVNAAVQQYFKTVDTTKSKDDIENSMTSLSELFTLPDLQLASTSSLICGSLVENGFSAKTVGAEITELIRSLVQTALPFADIYDREEAALEEVPDDFVEKLIAEKASEEQVNALKALDKFYYAATAIYASDTDVLKQAQLRLEGIENLSEISQGCYWLSKLFSTLFDEPVLIIDLRNKRGFTGTISGISDNFQLQALLMSLPELNTGRGLSKLFNKGLSEKQLATMNGTGNQSLEESMIGKWNMYDYRIPFEDISAKSLDKVGSLSSFWIWGEGKPADIPLFKGYRVILLDKPAYQRSWRVSRAFKCLKAGIAVEHILTEKEIDEWVDAMKSARTGNE